VGSETVHVICVASASFVSEYCALITSTGVSWHERTSNQVDAHAGTSDRETVNFSFPLAHVENSSTTCEGRSFRSNKCTKYHSEDENYTLHFKKLKVLKILIIKLWLTIWFWLSVFQFAFLLYFWIAHMETVASLINGFLT
jgi:hypothetical protein